jgi:MYXO-CTERM domain-containing protein
MGTCSELPTVPPGGYDCACDPGYEFDGTTCINIDECARNADDCDNDPIESTCMDTVGGFLCACNPGWTGGPNDGVTCDNVDECVTGTANCDFDGTDPANANYPSLAACNGAQPPVGVLGCAASCTDTPGSFTCACNVGWTGTGLACLDDNDCIPNPCQPVIEACVNEIGLPRTCQCRPFAQQMDGSCRIVCGDGRRAPGEQCDDGNPTPGDGCDATCRIEPRWACAEDATLLSICSMTCGDGFVDPLEECDDGPSNSDTVPDACRTTCDAAFCGDTVIDTAETCDDGDANSDTEPGACRTTCTRPICGDGTVDAGEVCDPGGGTARPVEDCTTRCGADAGIDSGVDPTDPPALTGGGCGCTTVGAPIAPSKLGLLLGLFGLALIFRRRKNA